MRKILMAIVCAVFLCFASTAMAISIYYEATDVTGVATLTYDISSPTNDAPVFAFASTSGTVDENLSTFTPGEYTISVTLDGFSADFNEDDVVDFNLPDISFTSGPYTIPFVPPLSGTYGQLTYAFDPYSGGSISYDFGDTGLTNAEVNLFLRNIDMTYSGAANGIMDANISWGKLRVELNSAPVPEPTTLLLSGLGLLGMGAYIRRKRSKK